MRENRGFVRLDIEAQAFFKVKNSPIPTQVGDLQDISCAGLRLLSREQLPEGAQLEMVLRIPGIEKELKVGGKVSWQRRLEVCLFDTGVEFIRIDEAEKNMLVEFIVKRTGRVEERREFVRADVSIPINYTSVNNPGQKKVCFSVDLSGSGLKVLIKEQVERGAELELVFKLPGAVDGICAQAIIVWIKSGQGELWEAGLEFTKIEEKDKNKINAFVSKAFGLSP